MASQGPRYSTAEATVDVSAGAWSNTSFVRAIDGADASHSSVGPAADFDYLELTGFGFALPAGATVVGVECTLTNIYETGGGGAVSIQGVMLIKGGVASGDSKLTGQALITAPGATHTAGGAADLWGLTLTEADVEAANFGVRLRVQAGVAAGGCGVNAISLTVHYTDPAGRAASLMMML